MVNRGMRERLISASIFGTNHVVGVVTWSQGLLLLGSVQNCRLCAQRFYGDDLPLVVNSLVFCASLLAFTQYF